MKNDLRGFDVHAHVVFQLRASTGILGAADPDKREATGDARL
jgi:hypothetical protein